MNILGDTLQLIAAEKAGIIKQHVPVVIGEYQPEVADIFLRKAVKEETELVFASDEWEVKSKVKSQKSKVELLDLEVMHNSQPTTHNLQLDLTGTYQLKNIKTVLSAVEELRKQGFTITDEHLQTALRQVKTLTGLHGRWEVLSMEPLTICDTGHNPEGIKEVLKNINATPYEHLHMVIGMVNDKDISKVLSLLPAGATYYFCRPDIPRGLAAEKIREQAAAFGLYGDAYPNVKAALKAAQKKAAKNDLVFVGGSTFVVAEVVGEPG
jgi:dihydrofolate synthase/folylpolyglutamate synthase